MLAKSQYFWSLFFSFGFAVFIGLDYGFWIGLLSYVVVMIFSGVVGWFSVFALPVGKMEVVGYLKWPVSCLLAYLLISLFI